MANPLVTPAHIVQNGIFHPSMLFCGLSK